VNIPTQAKTGLEWATRPIDNPSPTTTNRIPHPDFAGCPIL